MNRKILAVLAAAVAVLAAPAAASAATVTLSNGTATFTATSGEGNHLTVEYAGSNNTYLDFTDTGISQMTAGVGCTNQPGAKVRCPRSGVTALVLELGDGNDWVSNQTLISATVHGGFGNDTIFSGYGNDTVDGGAGNDSIDGSWGNDLISGGEGADSMSGSFGRDRVTYAGHSTGVTVTLDGAANDGAPGEGDNVSSSVDDVTGGPGDDVLTGDDGANELLGGGGNDTLVGLGGDDVLDGGSGTDSFDAGAGVDLVNARDGVAETVVCGSEADTVEGDHDEAANADCEVVNRSDAPPVVEDPPALPPTGGTGNVIEAPVAAISPAAVPVSAAGVASVRLKCPREAFEGCAGTITIEALATVGSNKNSKLAVEAARRRKTKTKLARRRYKMAAGQGQNVAVRLERRRWKKLKKRRKVRFRITVTMDNATGTTSTTRTVSVKPRKR